MKKTNIIVTLQVEGLHCWSNIPQSLMKEVPYLKSPHRHIFYIDCRKNVSHADRDIEIIRFKHQIEQYLLDQYYNADIKMLDLKSKSCEMLAEELCNKFQLNYCKVLEDGENGAEVCVDDLEYSLPKQIDNSNNITFICSYLCGGKSTMANLLKSNTYIHIEVSDIVRLLLDQQKGTRSDLQGHPELDVQIIEYINQLDLKNKYIISGTRQPSIIEAFPNATCIWIDTPVDQRFTRFMNNNGNKDDERTRSAFNLANQRDVELGIDQVKQLIFSTNSH